MDGYVTIGTKFDTKNFDEEIKQTEEKLNRMVKAYEKASNPPKGMKPNEEAMKNLRLEIERTSNKLVDLKKKQAGIGKVDLSSIGSSMSSIVKKVAKWSLAIFSVRSAYMLVRQAVSTISQYNEQFATDLEYIRYAMASSLQPVIERIVKLVQTLLTYINYIAKAWFGINLFASAKSFEDMKKSSSGVAKNAKEINKQLSSFDEMNILNENGKVSSAGNSITAPSFDLTNWGDIEVPGWIKWIADNKEIVLGTLAGIATAIAAIKIAKFASELSSAFKIFKGLSGLQIVALIAGIGVAISGIITLIKGVVDFIKDPSWANFNKILEGLTLILVGVGVALVALNATNPVGWIVLAIGAVTGLVTGLSSLAQSLFEDKAQILSTKEAQEQLTKAMQDAKNATNDYISAVDNAEEAQKRLEEAEKRTKISGEELYKAVQNGTLDYKEMDEAQREVYKAYINNQEAQEKLTTATENLTTAKENEKKASWENELAISKESKSYDKFKDSVVKAYKDGELSAEEARDYIERAMSGMSKASGQTFTKDLPNDIKDGLNPNKYKSTWNKFKEGFNEVWSSIKSGASNAWNWIKDKLGFSSGGVTFSTGGVGFAKGGVTGFADGGVNVVKMASGSVISQPGRGVPMSRAIGGEAGHEGIIPLTNSQMMSLLGKEIGQNVSIDLTNVFKVDSRQLARIQKIVNAQNDFAYNR